MVTGDAMPRGRTGGQKDRCEQGTRVLGGTGTAVGSEVGWMEERVQHPPHTRWMRGTNELAFSRCTCRRAECWLCVCLELCLECGIRAVWFCSCPLMILMYRRVSLIEEGDVWNCAAHTPSMEGGKRGNLEGSRECVWLGRRRGYGVGLGRYV